FPDPIPFRRVGEGGFVTIAGASIQVRAFYVAAVAFALAALVAWSIDRTRPGRGLQAIAADREGALVVGVPMTRLVPLAFGLAGGRGPPARRAPPAAWRPSSRDARL